MLRRKLLILMLALAALLLVLAIAALVALQNMVGELDHVNTQATALVDQCSELSADLSAVDVELHKLRSGQSRHLDTLIEKVESAQTLLDTIGRQYPLAEPEQAELYQSAQLALHNFARDVGVLGTTEDPLLVSQHTTSALEASARIRQITLQITRTAQIHAKAEMDAMMSHFRLLVLLLAIGFLVAINLSVLLLLRAASWVVRPVEQLVDASRQLARENFEYRVTVGQKGEFAELAQAFNNLAGELQKNEQRKIETLQQVALTLNHELNNAMATIEMQLALLRRQANDKQAMEKSLRQIHDNLERMAKVVESLGQVRRIVLTEYVGGRKMLDLEQSTRHEAPAGNAAGGK